MISFIKATDFDMWNVFTNVFDFKPIKDWTEKEKKMFSLNIRGMKILYSALIENDFEKIKFCSSAKDIWDTLDSIYASNEYVEVDIVGSSSETMSCISTIDEQLEVEDEEGEILEHFHDPVNTEEQENEDSQEKLMDDYNQSLSKAQDAHVDDPKMNGHKGIEKMNEKPRVSHGPMKKIIASITNRRTLGEPIAGATRSKRQKKQWLEARGVCSVSRMDYHRVPFNYLKESKKRRISQVSNRRLLKSISYERALPTTTRKHMKNQWVSKANSPSA
ncbi:hypothetical protein K1719_021456 [Acacia pycnantha]|nr:hypothetical protein K1719_021456 [Acacia pycnantha]